MGSQIKLLFGTGHYLGIIYLILIEIASIIGSLIKNRLLYESDNSGIGERLKRYGIKFSRKIYGKITVGNS